MKTQAKRRALNPLRGLSFLMMIPLLLTAHALADHGVVDDNIPPIVSPEYQLLTSNTAGPRNFGDTFDIAVVLEL